MKMIKLNEVLDVKRGASLAGKYYSVSGDKIRLTLGNFKYPNGGFKENISKDDIYFIGPVKSEFILKKGDIITPLTEQVYGLLGETATIPEDDIYIQSGDIGLIIVDSKKLYNRYAYYLLPSPLVRKQLGAGAQQTKIRHTSPDKIKDCFALIPEMEYQIKAADLLDDLNNKIKINNAIVSELESMAKIIYDYWFLQFDFPDVNGKPYKSSGGKMVWNGELKREIPQGWEVHELGTLFDSNRGVSYNSETIKGNGVPMINLASFTPNGEYNHRGLKYYSGEYSDEKVLKPYDLVMCNTQQTAIDFAKDIIGRAMLIPDLFDSDIVSSHHVTSIKVYDEYIKYYLLYLFNSNHFHKYVTGFANGTNIMGLIFDGVEKYKSEIPPEGLLKRFAAIVLDSEKMKSLIIKENKELVSLRDFLLPMLMNGQVTFKE